MCAEHAAHEGLDFDPRFKRERLEALLFGDRSRLDLRVVESGGRLVGYLSFSTEVSTWDAGEFLHLDCLYLRPDVRRQGLGTRIFALLEAEARARGLGAVQWQTTPLNQPARRFYERMGASMLLKLRFVLPIPSAPETI